jgi:arylsulfatase
MRPSLIAGRTDFTYYPGAFRIAESCAPNVKNRTHSITAEVVVPSGGADGVLVAAGGVVGGYTLFVKDGKPTYEYNWFTEARYRITGSQPLPAGPCTIRVLFEYDGGGIGKGGSVVMSVNDKEVAKGRVEHTVPARYSADETFDVGRDTGSPVSSEYESPFPYRGVLKKVEISLGDQRLTPEEATAIRDMEAAAAQARH